MAITPYQPLRQSHIYAPTYTNLADNSNHKKSDVRWPHAGWRTWLITIASYSSLILCNEHNSDQQCLLNFLVNVNSLLLSLHFCYIYVATQLLHKMSSPTSVEEIIIAIITICCLLKVQLMTQLKVQLHAYFTESHMLHVQLHNYYSNSQ